ncbi:hypothetical protein U1Q18_037220, partial [Sarracenia purpurea var. burkii]
MQDTRSPTNSIKITLTIKARIENQKKMKFTWKNQPKNKNIKRSLSSINHYPNLPFGENDDSSDSNIKQDRPRVDLATDFTAEKPEIDGAHKTLGSDDEEATKLADKFEAEGNKLAE